MTAHIKITEGDILPHVSASATPTQCEAVANYVYCELMRAVARARAAVDLLNECLPVRKVENVTLDDIAAFASDLADNIEARADMVREAREWDR